MNNNELAKYPKLNEHLLENFHKGIDYFEQANKTYTSDILEHQELNNVFINLYIDFYKKYTDASTNKDTILENLSNLNNIIDYACNAYELLRRVTKSTEKFLYYNKQHGFSGMSVVNNDVNEYFEYGIITNSRILNHDKVVDAYLDLSAVLGDSYVINNIYKINNFQVDIFTKYRYIDIVYDNKTPFIFNIFETSFFFTRFSVESVKVYNYDVEGTSTYDVEKLKRKVTIMFTDSQIANKIVIRYKLRDNESDYISIGRAYFTNKIYYNDIVTTKLNSYTESLLLEEFGKPFYNFASNRGLTFSVKSIDTLHVKKIKTYRIINNLADLRLILYPRPSSMSEVKIFKDFGVNHVIKSTDILGNSILISKKYMEDLGIQINDKLYITYETNEQSYEYIVKPNIRDVHLYRVKQDRLVVTLDLQVNATKGMMKVPFYEKRKNIYDYTYKKYVDTLEHSQGSGQDEQPTKIANIIYSGPIYGYVDYDHRSPVNTGDTIELEYRYIPGMIKVYIGDILIDIEDYVDTEFDGDPNIVLQKFKIVSDNITNENIVIKFSPTTDNVNIISNIDNSKLLTKNVDIQDSEIILLNSEIFMDNNILKEWDFKEGIYTHPIYKSVVYEPIGVDAIIEKIEIMDGGYKIKLVDTELTATTIRYNIKDNDISLNINVPFTLNGNTPFIFIHE